LPANILHFTSAELSGLIGHYLWPLFRISSFFMVVPLIGTRLVPVRIRLGLSLLVTVLVVPLIPPVPQVDALSLASVPIIAQQIFIGGLMGYSLILLMQLFVVTGQFISMQMGLGFASMIDPSNGINVPVLSQIYLTAVTLMFFFNGWSHSDDSEFY
jgi:flagellar biosynthetic protein FliR